MGSISIGFFNRMNDDKTLTDQLSVYNTKPAIFTTDPAPLDAVLPYIVCPPGYSDLPFDTFSTQGREIVRDIRCYAPKTGSVAAVEAIAERVRTLFHRSTISVTGYALVRCWVDNILFGPEEIDAYGLIVTVRVHLEAV